MFIYLLINCKRQVLVSLNDITKKILFNYIKSQSLKKEIMKIIA